MLSAFLLSLLSAAPDEFGPPLVLDADALYLAHRLLKTGPRPDSLTRAIWAANDDELDAQVCDVLFEDCSRHLDEFSRKEALARHRPELELIRKQSAELKTVVLGGNICIGEYDFKARRFPLNGFRLGSPGRTAPSSPVLTYPFGFAPVAKKPPQHLSLDEKAAADLVRGGNRCFDLRVEAVLPAKPIKWPATIKVVDPITRFATVIPAEPPEIPVDVKRIRLINADGATLASF